MSRRSILYFVVYELPHNPLEADIWGELEIASDGLTRLTINVNVSFALVCILKTYE